MRYVKEGRATEGSGGQELVTGGPPKQRRVDTEERDSTVRAREGPFKEKD